MCFESTSKAKTYRPQPAVGAAKYCPYWSVDHRVADGVAGAEFLADLKALLEEPRRALL